MPEPTPDRTALYRLYDIESDLLYIGISRTPEDRFKVHARYQSWWHLVEYIDLTWLPSYALARIEELARQRAERPPFNSMDHSQCRLSWDMPALKYDAGPETALTAKRIREALTEGRWQAGERLAAHVASRTLDLSPYLAAQALEQLHAEGLLRSLCKTFVVTERPVA
ncbi:hypothetical protein [Streptomyces sp. CBMA152]|uniref:hypothetical protein n=1 Tax=Streptomyces sp. CBMA152 TaxID=1896312 RepID=UPI00166008E1|nr:hypothetical protein [Streptomyces sp. CBMA152]MBD0743546.1 hypothetical protein [Streptomyces sp. CBMA152]